MTNLHLSIGMYIIIIGPHIYGMTHIWWNTDFLSYLVFRPRKKKPCFTGPTDPDFAFWQYFFFIYFLQKSCKISHFSGKFTKIM